MKASVKIMLSYDYSHFEVALSKDEDLDIAGVNELRKTAQRLADEAVRQYKKAKVMADKRQWDSANRDSFLNLCKRIEETVPESERTPEDVAALKARDDGSFEAQFDHRYDYEDDLGDDDEVV
jgi:hypothetical protein